MSWYGHEAARGEGNVGDRDSHLAVQRDNAKRDWQGRRDCWCTFVCSTDGGSNNASGKWTRCPLARVPDWLMARVTL